MSSLMPRHTILPQVLDLHSSEFIELSHHLNMSKTVHISSAAQFDSLINSSTIVVTDCELNTPHLPHYSRVCFDPHLAVSSGNDKRGS
jgi:hypothetical protein